MTFLIRDLPLETFCPMFFPKIRHDWRRIAHLVIKYPSTSMHIVCPCIPYIHAHSSIHIVYPCTFIMHDMYPYTFIHAYRMPMHPLYIHANFYGRFCGQKDSIMSSMGNNKKCASNELGWDRNIKVTIVVNDLQRVSELRQRMPRDVGSSFEKDYGPILDSLLI